MAEQAAPVEETNDGFTFDDISDEDFAGICDQLGVDVADAVAPEGEAVEEETADGEEAPESTDEATPAATSPAANASLDPAGMAAIAQACADECAKYVEKLTGLAEQVGAHDAKAGKKIAALAKQAGSLAKDATKAAEKASKAAEKKKLGEAAEMAQEADAACASIRELIDEAKSLMGGADIPDDDAPAEPAADAPPGRSAIEAWADSMA